MDPQVVSVIVNSLLALVAEVLPKITSSAAVQNVVNILINLVPIAIKEAQDVLPAIKGIIDTLRGADGVTEEQLAALDALDAQVDAGWDEAIKAALAADAAAGAT